MKPASRLIAKALPRGDKFAAQFALPGLTPDLVSRNGKPELFDTEDAADIAALRAVVALYNSRTIDERKAGGYRRMTGAELAVQLNKLSAGEGVTPTYFAELTGYPQHRVMKWLDGEQDIPHSVHLAAILLEDPENFEIAAKLAAGTLYERL